MCKIISVVNQKGGVGKTTTSVNLAAALVEEDKKVLVIDLDPQGNATTSLGINKSSISYSNYDVFANGVDLESVVIPTKIRNLDIAPGTMDLANAEIKLMSNVEKELVLAKAVQDVAHSYDYILIDCPPSLGILTINSMFASHSVLIPVQCEFFALEGLAQLMNTLKVMQKKQSLNGRKLEIEGIVLTMLDNRSNFGYEIINEVKTYYKEKVFKAIIPRTVHAQIAPSHGKPVTEYAPTSHCSKMYKKLAKEVLSNNG